MAGGYRIEMEEKGHHCSVMTSMIIDRYLEENGFDWHKTNNLEEICKTVDWLNNQVKEGNIILVDGRRWVPEKYRHEGKK